jgi:type I restriction enzyme S subunit
MWLRNLEAILNKMGNFDKYPAYKDSGVEWLGEIPTGWSAQRLKFIANINADSLPENTSGGFEFDYVDIGSISYENGIESTEHFTFSNAPSRARRLAKNGDTVISTVRTYLKAIDLITPDKSGLVFSTGFAVLNPRKNVIPSFLLHFVRSSPFTKQVELSSKGMSYPAINSTDLSCLLIFLPSLPEQTAIAAFLDEKTAKIDTAIAQKEQMISLLKERKQILIQNAVTNGINPDAKMKDSGVEWIGEIPEGWEVARVKQYARKISKGTTPSTEGRNIIDEGPIRYIKAENIQDGVINNYPAHFIDEKTNELIKRSQLQENDVLFVIAGATLGKVAIVGKEHSPSNTNQAVAFVRPNSKIIPTYLSVWLSSSTVKELTWLDAVQSAQPNLSMENLGNFPMALPSLIEQSLILEHIETQSAKIDTAISIQQQQIAKLKEYKSTLIDSAVTGKIKVC